MSNNSITQLPDGLENRCDYLSIYNNPLSFIYWIGFVSGSDIMISYDESLDFNNYMKDDFFNFYIFDCPLDKQVEVSRAITGDEFSSRVKFPTEEEMKKIIDDTKYKEVLGYIEPVNSANK